MPIHSLVKRNFIVTHHRPQYYTSHNSNGHGGKCRPVTAITVIGQMPDPTPIKTQYEHFQS